MKPIRLCLVIPTLDRGGAEKQLCLLAAGLPRELFDVHVVVLTRTGPREEDLKRAGIPVHIIGKSTKFEPSALLKLTRLFKSLNPDIVHTWIFAANCYGRLAAKWAKVPYILGGERCIDLWKTRRHLMIDRYLARFTRRMITNSSGVVEFYAQNGIPPDLFRVIPNGIPPRDVSMSESGTQEITREEALGRLGVPLHRRVVGTIGRLWPQKRYRDMICAADLLGVIRDDICLVIIGDGPQRDELQRYRDLVTSQDWVRFVGERQDVAQLLPHMEVFWMTSGYEGQSNAMMEAMQAARPIVATDIPGNRDLVENNVSGILVPLGSTADFAKHTNLLFDDPGRCKSLGIAAAQRITEHFSVELMIARHESLYRELMATRS